MEGIQTINALKAVQSSLPAQTTIPSNELVMLYAADGTPIAKIARDDLVKAVASVMASNSQTTFSKLLGVQANGTPMGIGASDLASVLNYVINEVSVAQGEETEVSLGGLGFVFARDEFYNSYGALWYVHGNTILPVYEEDSNTLSVTNSSARLYCTVRESSGVEYLKIKNNYSGGVKLKYKLIKL